jgi:hypothetical protein
MIAQVRYSVAGQLRGRVASCAVSTVHVETRSASFLVEPQYQGRQFVSGLASKPLGRFSPVWPQNQRRRFLAVWPPKSVAMVFTGLASKPVAMIFSCLASKLVAMVSPGLTSKPTMGFLVEPQNQGGGGFPSLCLKTDSFGLLTWVSKSPQRFLGLDLKTMWASVSRLCHKTNGGRSARDTRRDLAACFVWKQVWLGFSSLA